MPYLTSEDKTRLDSNGFFKLREYTDNLSAQDVAGTINYLNFKLIKSWINKNGKKYWIFALIVGTLICCVLEIYRRLIADYEDSAIERNGDVE
jgi:hypothetical protein